MMIESSSIETNPSLCLRLHLVRHGETEANERGIVLGQIDSPLTPRGVEQSYAARRAFGRYPFWKKFSSDLYRAQRTARIISGIEKQREKKQGSETDDTESDDQEEGLILDPRLRERAKGVREGQDKRLTYDEALKIFIESRLKDVLIDEPKLKIPKHENDEEVWERFKDFIQDNLLDAYLEYAKMHRVKGSQYDEYKRKRSKRNFDLLAISHSGTLRIAIKNLVQDQLPIDVEREEQDKDGHREGRLKVPNTSKTIIEFTPCENMNSSLRTPLPNGKFIFWKAKLVDFANVKHLK